MSRIGRLKIELPDGVTVAIKGNNVKVKGKLGESEIDAHERMSVKEEDGALKVTRASDAKEDRALHGLTRALIANMVVGVSEGYKKVLEVQGVGYRADAKKGALVLNVGYSQPVEFKIPKYVEVEVDKKNNISISGIDKQQVGQVAADIRKVRPPDAYKGKGIRYQGEIIKLKEGKSGV